MPEAAPRTQAWPAGGSKERYTERVPEGPTELTPMALRHTPLALAPDHGRRPAAPVCVAAFMQTHNRNRHVALSHC